jgi:hypothetical protein
MVLFCVPLASQLDQSEYLKLVHAIIPGIGGGRGVAVGTGTGVDVGFGGQMREIAKATTQIITQTRAYNRRKFFGLL